MANRNFRWALLASTALIGLAATPGFAQTTKTKAPEAKATETKSTGSTYLSPLVVSAASIAGGAGDPYTKTSAASTVSKDEIGQFGGQNIDNALRTQPGVFTRDNMQNTGVAVNVRGLEGSGRVSMSIDGAKQSFRFTGHEASGFTYVDPALLSGVDIQRGAVDGAAGAGALAGSANFRTLSIDDVLTDPDKAYGGYVTSSIGDNGDGVAPSGAAGFRVNDTFALLGATSYRKSGDYSNAAGQVVTNTGQETWSDLVKAEITPSADQKITIGGIYYSSNFTANSYVQNVTNMTGTVHYDYTPADNDLADLHANLYINDTKMKYLAADPAASALCDGLYGPGAGASFIPNAGRVIDDLGAGFDVTNTSRGVLGDAPVSSTYGLSVSGDNVNVVNNGKSSASGVNPSGVSTLSSIYDSTTVGLGAFDLTGGLRFDYYTVNGEGAALAGNPLGLPAGTFNVSAANGRLNPSLKIVINNLDWFQPYVSYAETFRPPTSNELLLGGSHPGGSAQNYSPNPTLKPEIARTVELGVNVVKDGLITEDDKLQIKAGVFVSKVDNYISVANTGSIYYFANNPGTSTLSGFELQAGYDAGSAFATLAYSHTTSDLKTPNPSFGSASFLPTDVFTATAGVRLLDDHSLTLGGRLYAVSESFNGTTYDDGYKLVDLFANYKPTKNIELGAGVSNLFNVAYTPALSTTPATANGAPTGRGRTFELTAKAKF